MMFMMLCMDLSEWFSDPNATIGVLLTAIGLAVALLAKRITRAIRRTDKIGDDDKIFLSIKVLGFILILVGFIFVIQASRLRI